MKGSPALPWVCLHDFARRSSVAVRPRHVLIAPHLRGHPSLALADVLLADIRVGRPLDRHLSLMKAQRAAFKRAHRKGDWTDYRRFMDHLLNKWGFYHFHCGGGSMLVFVHFCDAMGAACVLDLVPHDGNWLVEKRLVEIAVRNWPEARIARSFGEGPSRMTELDLLRARKQGLNMMVNVDGIYYLPARGALMSDGSGYSRGFVVPIGIVARRYEPGEDPAGWVTSPQMLVLGTDPDDPRTPWELAAALAGMLAAQSRMS